MELMACRRYRCSLLPILCAAALAQTPPPVSAIKDVVARYNDARDRKDPKATEALFTEDADQLVSSGEWRRGRDAVGKGTMASSESSGGKRTITVETVHAPRPARPAQVTLRVDRRHVGQAASLRGG